MDDSILEPLKAYNSKYKEEFHKNCEEYFDGLVKKSGINAEQNKKTVSEYRLKRALIEKTKGLMSRYRFFQGLLIFSIVLGVVLLLIGIFSLVQENLTAGIVLLGLGAVQVIGAPVLLMKVIRPRLRNAEERKKKLEEKAEALLHTAWEQMAPLNALFEGNVTKKLIEKTVSLLLLDDNFNVRRYDYLNGKYGYGENDDPETSTIGILTGEIAGNPFVVDRVLVHSMGSCTYTGSLIIHWETHEHDSDGHWVTVHHSQTLNASINRPKPYYSKRTRLIYGNEAAPDLHFSRSPAHVEDLSEKERERKVEKGVKKIRKRQKQALENGKSFTEMGNSEFEVLFGASDRDNEVEFRLLFTPLAQKNMLSLLKDSAGYGDDFTMQKSGCLNYISSEHSAAWDMDETRSRYFSYSLELARQTFLQFNSQYFQSLYFDLAPLLSIPLYQQHKPHEYLYRESYPRHFTRQETEYAVNRIGSDAFAPPAAATESILKTRFLNRDGESDRVQVTANAYTAIERTEFVSVLGGDGFFHSVPVNWVEYVPISATSTIEMKEIGISDREFSMKAQSGEFQSAILKHGKLAYGYHHGILCCLVPEGETSFDADFQIAKK